MRFREWLLVVVWASLIFAFSTDTFSSEHTQSVVVSVLHTLFPAAAESTLLALHDFLRKCAHVCEYFVFGVLLYGIGVFAVLVSAGISLAAFASLWLLRPRPAPATAPAASD